MSALESPGAGQPDFVNGTLVCRSCPRDWPSEARYIGNAYGGRRDGSSWDWPLCNEHVQMAMVAGWFPIREVGQDPPFTTDAKLATPTGSAEQ